MPGSCAASHGDGRRHLARQDLVYRIGKSLIAKATAVLADGNRLVRGKKDATARFSDLVYRCLSYGWYSCAFARSGDRARIQSLDAGAFIRSAFCRIEENPRDDREVVWANVVEAGILINPAAT